jgi:hypothetical protein
MFNVAPDDVMTAFFARRCVLRLFPCPLFSEAIIAKKAEAPSLDKGGEKGVFRLMEVDRNF